MTHPIPVIKKGLHSTLHSFAVICHQGSLKVILNPLSFFPLPLLHSSVCSANIISKFHSQRDAQLWLDKMLKHLFLTCQMKMDGGKGESETPQLRHISSGYLLYSLSLFIVVGPVNGLTFQTLGLPVEDEDMTTWHLMSNIMMVDTHGWIDHQAYRAHLLAGLLGIFAFSLLVVVSILMPLQETSQSQI